MTVAAGDFGREMRRILQPVMKQHGFQRKGTKFLRTTDNLLHYISLERPPGRFTTQVVVQPLFFPYRTRVVAFGDRVGRFIDGRDHWYQLETEEQLVTGLEETARELKEYGIPWLNRLKTVRELVDWYSDVRRGDRPRPGMRSGWYPIWMGYCHAYLGDFQVARNLIAENLDRVSSPELPDYEPTRHLLQALVQDHSAVPRLLEAYALETRARLKV